MPPNDFLKQFSESFNHAAKAIKAVQHAHAENVRRLQEASENFLNSISSLAKFTLDLPQTLQNFDKAGLPSNLGENRSLRKLKKYEKLLRGGYPLFWIPSASVVDALVGATTEAQRKAVIIDNKPQILEDCKKAIAQMDRKDLKDARLHLEAAVQAMEQGNYRGAQSTASVCIDAHIDQIIDTTMLGHYNQVNGRLHNDSKKLKTFNQVPIAVLYAALQAQLIVFVMRDFDRLRPNTVRIKYSRHSSIHSVSARQYSEFNALQAIMIGTSILATSERLGKGWLSDIAAVA